jgi:hypothetical protein
MITLVCGLIAIVAGGAASYCAKDKLGDPIPVWLPACAPLGFQLPKSAFR